MKTEIAFGVMNVTRQSTEPALTDASPEQYSNDGYDHADDDQKFAKVIHVFDLRYTIYASPESADALV